MTDAPTERYLVTMRSVVALPDGSIQTHQATDHVTADHLDAYVADAQTRWQAVIVADTPDLIVGDYTPSDASLSDATPTSN